MLSFVPSHYRAEDGREKVVGFLLFGVWIKLATFPTSKAMRQFQQIDIRNTFEMHLTLALTLNIQKFILLQHNVWVLLPPAKGSGQ